MEYLINVGLTFAPKLVLGVCVWLIASLVMKQFAQFKNQPVYKNNSKYLGVFLVVMFLYSAFSPSITYKHQTFNAVQEDYNIKQLNQQKHERTDLVIQDRTKEDHSVTDQEWEDRSSYNKR